MSNMPKSPRPRWALGSSVLAAVALAVSLVVAPAAAGAASPTSTAASVPAGAAVVPQSMNGFDPGNIIEDAVFFNKGTMGEAQIQSFLNSKVSTCASG